MNTQNTKNALRTKLYRQGFKNSGKMATFLMDVFTKTDGFISEHDVYNRRLCEYGMFVNWAQHLRSKNILNYKGRKPSNNIFRPGSAILKYILGEDYKW